MLRRICFTAALITVWIFGIEAGKAQSSSGTISGRALDSTGKSVAGAAVTVVKRDTLEVRTFSTGADGAFAVTALQPGPYTLKVEAPGFKSIEKAEFRLSSSERLSVGDLILQVGAVKEVIDVKSETSPIQTASSERSALVDSNQVTNLTTRGRDVF